MITLTIVAIVIVLGIVALWIRDLKRHRVERPIDTISYRPWDDHQE